MIQESIRNMLHEYIEHADEKKIAAIYTLVEGDIKTRASRYTEAEIAQFVATRDGFLTGKIKGSPMVESMARIRKKMNLDGL